MGLGPAFMRAFAQAMRCEVHARLDPPRRLVITLLALSSPG
jgi:hypothetical protein